MQVPHNACVVVADGRKMLVFRNEGDAEFPKLEVERQKASELAGTSDEAGAYDEGDFQQLAEDRFAAETADMLKTRALRNEFEQLIIVAPPRTLGELRKHYHKEVEKRLAGEVAKDLTGHTVVDIEKILQAE